MHAGQPPTRSACTMLAEFYGFCALPCSSDTLLLLVPKESLTGHNKLKKILIFRLYIRNSFCVVYVCVCVCATMRACECAYPAFPPTPPPKSQGFRFRFTFSTRVQILNRVLFTILGPNIKCKIENKHA